MTRKTAAWREFQDLWSDVLHDLAHPDLIRGRLPQGWEEIDGRPVAEQVRITLRVDKDVARYFRGLGPGYQKRVNKVLRAYMLARMSELVVPEDAAPRGGAGKVPPAEFLEIERDMARQLEQLRRARIGPTLSEMSRASLEGLRAELEKGGASGQGG